MCSSSEMLSRIDLFKILWILFKIYINENEGVIYMKLEFLRVETLL